MSNFIKKRLSFKNKKNIYVGMDIGGSLTKIAISLKKNNNSEISKILKNEYDSNEIIDIDENHLFIKFFPTSKFGTDTVNFLKSKIKMN